MKVSRVHTLIIFSIALDLSLCRAYGQQPRGDAGKITVAVVQATSATIRQPYPCLIKSIAPVFVRSPVKGRVEAILVNKGQAVKRGDPLFTVQPDRDEQKGWDRIVSVEAPCTGPVLSFLDSKPGGLVGKRTHVLTLGDTGVIRVHFEIPEKHYLELIRMNERGFDWKNEDLHLILADHGNYPHVGKIVDFLAGRPEKGAGYVRVAAEFPNPDGVLHRGQTCTLLLRRRVEDAILIPRRATFDAPGFRRRPERLPTLSWSARLSRSGILVPARLENIVARFEPITTFLEFLENIRARFELSTAQYVYVVDENHVAHQRGITVEGGADDVLIVRKGIGVGDRIVVDGVARVSDGDKVK